MESLLRVLHSQPFHRLQLRYAAWFKGAIVILDEHSYRFGLLWEGFALR